MRKDLNPFIVQSKTTKGKWTDEKTYYHIRAAFNAARKLKTKSRKKVRLIDGITRKVVMGNLSIKFRRAKATIVYRGNYY